MVIVNLQSCHSLVSSRRCNLGLLFHSLFSSLPVPFPANIRLLNYPIFSSHPIPFPNNICVFINSLIYSLPVPFPIIFVLLFVLICWISTYACPRLRLQHIPLVLQPRDSRTRPSPVSWTRIWISLDIIVCQLMTLDCVLFSGAYHIKENYFFTPEFCLAIGSYSLCLTLHCKLLCKMVQKLSYEMLARLHSLPVYHRKWATGTTPLTSTDTETDNIVAWTDNNARLLTPTKSAWNHAMQVVYVYSWWMANEICWKAIY